MCLGVGRSRLRSCLCSTSDVSDLEVGCLRVDDGRCWGGGIADGEAYAYDESGLADVLGAADEYIDGLWVCPHPQDWGFGKGLERALGSCHDGGHWLLMATSGE